MADDRIDVRGDGRIILFKRSWLKNPKWIARVRVPNGNSYKIQTTKTNDVAQATAIAIQLYEQTYLHVKSGGKIHSKTFTQLFNQWVETEPNPDHVARVRMYALKYFANVKLDSIDSNSFAQYWTYRRTNFTNKKPANSTLVRERVAIAALLRYGKAVKLINDIPDLNPTQITAGPNRRPTLTADEWTTFLKAADRWVADGVNTAVARDRQLAALYFRLLALSGIRVGEARSLRWVDVAMLPSQAAVLTVRGKTGSRQAVTQVGIQPVLEQLRQLTYQRSTSLLFSHPDGKPVHSFKRSFQSIFHAAGLPLNGRSIYSLRHYYATERLSHGVSPFLLARNMGTSVEMLENHYGHVVNSDLAQQINKLSDI